MPAKSLVVPLFGVGAIAFTIGLTTGISASPVVGVLIPLLFGLLTAGGGVYVVKNLPALREAGTSLGAYLVVFSLAFLVGLWAGSAAKLHPEQVWFFEDRVRPAYGELEAFDLRVTAAFLRLDRQMSQSGLRFEERVRVLRKLQDRIKSRLDSDTGGLASTDEDATKAILGLSDSWNGPFDPVALAEPRGTSLGV